ncbi:hypothetical protein PAHAL_6G251200 [Panicum hallii]|uniref:Uncharacterized protein n=1 Tax=Panicum hallii TaxID=206008 RepID=A0A2T8IHI0_9POAL|nr:hypothetical protein PAHAL_6G251200 [Panicum hallii]
MVAVALDNLAGGHVDGEEVALQEEVDDGGVIGVDEREHGDLLGEASGLVGVVGPDVGEGGLVLQRPLRGVRVGQGPDARSPGGERDEAEHGVVGEGVGGDDSPGVVGPPEPAEVCERAERSQRARRERVVQALVDPLAGVGVVAAELGVVAADDGQELGDHVAAAAAGAGEDAEEPLVLDGLLGARVREAERGPRGGVEDEVARVGVHPAERLAVGALDAGERGVEDGREEEQPRGVLGGYEREALRRGAVREHPRGDGQARDARGRGERQRHVGTALDDARDAAEDDPRRRRRGWRGGAGGGVCGAS